MQLQSRWSKRILAVLAAAVCGMMFYFVLLSERDLRQTGSSSQALYSKRVVGLSLQGDLQYATQESRRTFLYVLTDGRQASPTRLHRRRSQSRPVGKSTGGENGHAWDGQGRRPPHSRILREVDSLSGDSRRHYRPCAGRSQGRRAETETRDRRDPF